MQIPRAISDVCRITKVDEQHLCIKADANSSHSRPNMKYGSEEE